MENLRESTAAEGVCVMAVPGGESRKIKDLGALKAYFLLVDFLGWKCFVFLQPLGFQKPHGDAMA